MRLICVHIIVYDMYMLYEIVYLLFWNMYIQYSLYINLIRNTPFSFEQKSFEQKSCRAAHLPTKSPQVGQYLLRYRADRCPSRSAMGGIPLGGSYAIWMVVFNGKSRGTQEVQNDQTWITTLVVSPENMDHPSSQRRNFCLVVHSQGVVMHQYDNHTWILWEYPHIWMSTGKTTIKSLIFW